MNFRSFDGSRCGFPKPLNLFHSIRKNLMNIVKTTLSVAALFCCQGMAQAQSNMLDAVPMQGSMVMPMFRYMAAHASLHVMVPDTRPMLMPLEMSHPDHHFHATAPWYHALDPAHHGMAFNRQYGFVMDPSSDFLPLGAGIWIRQTSADPGLKSFLYRGGDAADQAWEPMFGTDGSEDTFEWNLKMFHPAFAAPKGSAALKASFEAFVVDLGTGMPMEDIETASFTLHWDVPAPSGEPNLSIETKVVLSWEGAYAGYMVESSASLEHPMWHPMGMTPTLVDGAYVVLVDSNHPNQFFRLRKMLPGEGQDGSMDHGDHPDHHAHP